jgi:RecA/RadA recombinase
MTEHSHVRLFPRAKRSTMGSSPGAANARAMDDCIRVMTAVARVIRCTVALTWATTHDSA